MAPLRKFMDWHHIVLIFILILAAGLRFYQLDDLPLGFYHDEAYNGLDALALNEGQTFPIFHEGWELYSATAFAERPPHESRFPIFFEGNYGREPVHVYLMAISVWLFGGTPFAIRAVPAASGVLAVLTVYWTASIFVGEKRGKQNPSVPIGIVAPLIAAFAMAVLFPAVHFSRYALRMMVFVPVEVMCVYFFWRGIEQWGEHEKCLKGYVPFILSGILLGFGLYIYSAGRLFPFLFAIFVSIWLVLDRSTLQNLWQPIALMAAVSALVVAPLLLYFWRYPYFLFVRAAYVLENGTGVIDGRPWLTRWYNLGRVMRGFLFYGEESFRHNLPGRPFMDVVQSFFFCVGSGRLFASSFGKRPFKQASEKQIEWAQLKSIFLILWFFIMILPSVLSSSAPHFGRLTGVMPVLAIIIGLGAESIWQWVVMRRPFKQQTNKQTIYRGLCIFFCILMGCSAYWTARDYFVTYATLPPMQTLFDQADWEMGNVMDDISDEYHLYMSPPQAKLATLYFALGAKRSTLRNFDGSTSLVPLGIPDKGSAYFVHVDDDASLQNLRSFFPDGQIREPLQQFTPFIVESPFEPIERSNPAIDFAGEIELYDWHIQQDENAIHVTLIWQGKADIKRDYTAFIHLLDEKGEIIAQTDRPPAGYPTSDWRAGELVMDRFSIILPPENSEISISSVRTGFYFLPTLEPLGSPAFIDPITDQN